jgi:unsaturated rhamnogalacturonyl hydrolase
MDTTQRIGYKALLAGLVDAVLQDCRPDTAKWNYETGLLLCAVRNTSQKLFANSRDEALRKIAETLVAPDGSITGYRLDEFNIDQINAGKFILSMWKDSGDERFKIAVEQLMRQLVSHPRTPSGSYWHKKIYPNQVWLDGLYMFGPFAARYATEFYSPKLFDDICLQLFHVRDGMKDEASGLYYHAMDESRLMGWSDPISGLSPHIWGRAVGWLSMALVDVLDWLPENYSGRPGLIAMYRDLMKAVAKVQDGSGLWFQILDMAGAPGNYLEESASAMFAYGFLKGMRRGILEPAVFVKPAERALAGICDRFVTRDTAGRVHVGGICKVAGLGGNPYRDGSYAYYLSEPIVSDDYKGTGPLILALCEACRQF